MRPEDYRALANDYEKNHGPTVGGLLRRAAEDLEEALACADKPPALPEEPTRKRGRWRPTQHVCILCSYERDEQDKAVAHEHLHLWLIPMTMPGFNWGLPLKYGPFTGEDRWEQATQEAHRVQTYVDALLAAVRADEIA